MLEVLIQNIFSMFVGPAFQETVGIPVAINRVSLLISFFFWYTAIHPPDDHKLLRMRGIKFIKK